MPAPLAFIERLYFFFSSRRRHTRSLRDWSSDVCSSDLQVGAEPQRRRARAARELAEVPGSRALGVARRVARGRSEEHTSELQSRRDLVCRLLLEKKNEFTVPRLLARDADIALLLLRLDV